MTLQEQILAKAAQREAAAKLAEQNAALGIAPPPP
jgi:hypothetical protein